MSRQEEESILRKERLEAQAAEAHAQLKELKKMIASEESELRAREALLAQRVREFDETNSKQVQQRIEQKVLEYVAAALSVLEGREATYRKKAFGWGLLGTVLLALAISGTVALSLYGYAYGEKLSDLGWQTMIFVSFKGLVVLGVLGLWAKHAFTVSNAYMHEAIKRADQAHAINFGKLYLEIYGNSVDRKELLDIFENWNIASESAFSKANPDGFEPKVLDKLVDVLKIAERGKKGAAV